MDTTDTRTYGHRYRGMDGESPPGTGTTGHRQLTGHQHRRGGAPQAAVFEVGTTTGIPPKSTTDSAEIDHPVVELLTGTAVEPIGHHLVAIFEAHLAVRSWQVTTERQQRNPFTPNVCSDLDRIPVVSANSP